MRTRDYDFDLPQEQIAQIPVEPRDHSRLMVLDRSDGSIRHHRFYEIDQWLRPGDLLVVNNTRVIPARLIGNKPTGAQIEVFLLEPDPRFPADASTQQWKTLVRPGRKIHPGERVSFGEGLFEALCIERTEDGGRIMRFHRSASSGFSIQQSMRQVGQIPFPPYVEKPLDDPERYQTVFSAQEGAVAAPTAGLHFTPPLIERLKSQGIHWAEITLHVGIGTFRPIQTELVEDHEIHSEWFRVSPSALEQIFHTRKNGGRIIAVGTTSVRVLETIALSTPNQADGGFAGKTGIYIYPPYDFRLVDQIITNFHLPRSSLLLLVSAFSGREFILRAYQKAVEMGYRFFSFGDACLLK